MSNEVNLRTFPKTPCEALAMLYVEHQDLSKMTPEQVLDMYLDAHKKMCTHINSQQHKRILNE